MIYMFTHPPRALYRPHWLKIEKGCLLYTGINLFRRTTPNSPEYYSQERRIHEEFRNTRMNVYTHTYIHPHIYIRLCIYPHPVFSLFERLNFLRLHVLA